MEPRDLMKAYDIKVTDGNQLENLLSSEVFYWLSTAVALSFTREVIFGNFKTNSEDVVASFTSALRKGEDKIDAEVIKEAQSNCLSALKDIKAYLNDCMMFDRKRAIPLCLGFTRYWLFTKLIELEWQKKAIEEDLVETYLFLDGVIADQEELTLIEEKVKKEDTLYDDEIIYLRTHFRNAQEFFRGLENELKLISLGHLTRKN